MPFVHLIFFLFFPVVFFAVFFAGGMLLFRGWKQDRRLLMFLGGGLMAVVVALVVQSIVNESQHDLNPDIASDDQIVGTWSGPGEILVLQADHTFTYQSDEDDLSGTWSRRDWTLTLMTTSTHREMRVIRYFGKLRVVTHLPQNVDLYDESAALILQE